MAARLDSAQWARMAAQGVHGLASAEAMTALHALLATDTLPASSQAPAQVAVLAMDWPTYASGSERADFARKNLDRGPSPQIGSGGPISEGNP